MGKAFAGGFRTGMPTWIGDGVVSGQLEKSNPLGALFNLESPPTVGYSSGLSTFGVEDSPASFWCRYFFTARRDEKWEIGGTDRI